MMSGLASAVAAHQSDPLSGLNCAPQVTEQHLVANLDMESNRRQQRHVSARVLEGLHNRELVEI